MEINSPHKFEGKEVVENHRHKCPRCHREYPAYNPRCNDHREYTLCYKCLAKTFK